MANIGNQLSRVEAASGAAGRVRLVAVGPDETEEQACRRSGVDRASFGPSDTLLFVATGVPRSAGWCRR
jgi:hypothetical protein